MAHSVNVLKNLWPDMPADVEAQLREYCDQPVYTVVAYEFDTDDFPPLDDEDQLEGINMGYTTEFSGQINIDPPLNHEEIVYLTKFAGARRMKCDQGPYYVDRGDFMGQANGPDVIDYNSPPEGQPGLWCQWEPTEDGRAIEWNGTEKFYDSVEWMQYLIDHFLRPEALAKGVLPFLQANHILNGTIKAQGEDIDDRWELVVRDNLVSEVRLSEDGIQDLIAERDSWRIAHDDLLNLAKAVVRKLYDAESMSMDQRRDLARTIEAALRDHSVTDQPRTQP